MRALWLLPLIAACTVPKTPEPSRGGAVALTSCLLRQGAGPGQKALCGTHRVFENRQTRTGRTIDLNIAVIPAREEPHAPDPVFFFAGGPGQAATESWSMIARALAPLKHRDIVLIDQRGTGQSNPLDCPDDEVDEDRAPTPEEIQRFAEKCLESLEADVTQYTTPIAVDDIDEVRAALGYERINIVGISYGTRFGLVYLRRHGDHVRTAVLDGLYPTGVALADEVAGNGERALGRVVKRCATSPDCRARFPELGAQVEALFAKLEAKPASTLVEVPRTGERKRIEINAEQLSSWTRLFLYSTDLAALFPLLIDDAARRGSFDRIGSQAVRTSETLSEVMSGGLNVSVICAEDFPIMSASAETSTAGLARTNGERDRIKQICEHWKRGAVPDSYHAPVTSERPVLLLSGEADPVTPPRYGERVKRTLPNSVHLVAPGHGHAALTLPCMGKIARRVIREGSIAELDTECMKRIEPPPFFTSFAGPTP